MLIRHWKVVEITNTYFCLLLLRRLTCPYIIGVATMRDMAHTIPITLCARRVVQVYLALIGYKIA